MTSTLARVLCAGALLFALRTPVHAEEALVDGIAAQVGSGIVLVSEIEEMAAPVIERAKAANVPESELMGIRKDALERLIESRLIDDVIVQLELTATDAEVDAAIEGIAAESGLTVRQLRQSVAGYGMGFDDYRAKIKAEIERNKVLSSMVRQRVRIEEDEVVAVYEKHFGDQPKGGSEYHLRHILVTFGGETMRDPQTACKIVEDARAEIASGQRQFEQVASRISVVNPQGGGDMGWVHADELAGWMKGPLDALQGGETLSPVIEMPFGCNLLQLVEFREFDGTSLEEARPAIEDRLYRQKTEAEYIKWVSELRKQVYIERKGIYAAAPLMARP